MGVSRDRFGPQPAHHPIEVAEVELGGAGGGQAEDESEGRHVAIVWCIGGLSVICGSASDATVPRRLFQGTTFFRKGSARRVASRKIFTVAESVP